MTETTVSGAGTATTSSTPITVDSIVEIIEVYDGDLPGPAAWSDVVVPLSKGYAFGTTSQTPVSYTHLTLPTKRIV